MLSLTQKFCWGLLVLAVLVAAAGAQTPAITAEAINAFSRSAISTALPAVVYINVAGETLTPFGPRAMVAGGSGFIIDPAGWVVTNTHVVSSGDAIEVRLADGRYFPAIEVFKDPDTDVAVVRIDPDGVELPSVSFGDSTQTAVGDWVFAIGSPFGQQFQQTVTSGIVSFKGRRTGMLDSDWGYEDFIQTDADINQGNSGGPLIDLHGKVIGVNTMIASNSGASVGLGFAIPSEMAEFVVNELIAHGSVQRGYLGVAMLGPGSLSLLRNNIHKLSAAQTDDIAEFIKSLPDDLTGAVITEITDDSPAAAAGLQKNDVLTAVDDIAITTSKQARNLISRRKPDTTVRCTVWRDGTQHIIEVTLADRDAYKQISQKTPPGRVDRAIDRFKDLLPDSWKRRFGDDDASVPAPPIAETPDGPRLGVALRQLNADLAVQLGYASDQNGLLIMEILPASVAADSDLARGDVIVAADGQPITDVAQLRDAIAQVDFQHDTVTLTVLRSRTQRDIVVGNVP